MADIRDRAAAWLDDGHDWVWGPARLLPLRWAFTPYQVVMPVLCAVLGHVPRCARCDQPDWDECRWCATSLPGLAHPGAVPCPGWVPRHEAVDR